MRKRLLSLLLVACMILPMIPVMAIVAWATEGDGTYSTNFSFDATNPNFPTLDLPAATEESNPQYTFGPYDFSGLEANNGKLDGAITYNGNWAIGALPVSWTNTKENGVYTVLPVVGTAFTPYNRITRAAAKELCITDSQGIWASSASGLGGGLWLVSLAGVVVAPINYVNVPNDPPVTPANSDPRNSDTYRATGAIRYTAEYTGEINISMIVGFHSANGIDLVVLHNGVEIGRVENDGTNLAAATYDLEALQNVSVTTGDTIDFVSLGDPNYEYAQLGSDFNYQRSKRGYKDFSFTKSDRSHVVL